MGWQKHILSSGDFPLKFRENYYKLSDFVKNWMYSWMKPMCETREEYELSKALLLQYVKSEKVDAMLGGTLFMESFLTFFRHYVEPLEAYYVYYLRKDIRHYGEYTNSIHEGTNRGLKYNAAPVGPSTRLDNSLVILSKNGLRNLERKKISSSYQFSTERPHQKTSSTNELVDLMDHKLQKLNEMLPNYQCIKILGNKWLVGPSELGLNQKKKLVYPTFYRIRTVTYKDGILHCSCPRTNTYGDICIHSLIVAKSHKSYDQPTHHDYSVVWWKSFLHFSLIHWQSHA